MVSTPHLESGEELMTYPRIPATPEELSVDLLNDHLARSDKWEKGPFESINITLPHGSLDGMSGSVYKIFGLFESGDSIPLITKFRDIGGSPEQLGGSPAEINFYRNIADIAGVASPLTYVAEFDQSSGYTMIIQEHLAEGTVGSIQTYLSVVEVTRIVRALAGMHAKWWNSVELANLKSVRTFEEVWDAGAMLFASGVYSGRRFYEKYGDRVHPEVVSFFDSDTHWGPIVRSGFSSNRTLCHYDVAAKNLSLPKDPTEPPVFFDWSLLVKGSIGVELGQVVAYSLRIEEHHRIPEVLDSYIESMRELGVVDLSRDILWEDVRYGLLTRLAAPIALTSRNYPPAEALALELLPRITSAVLATNAFDLLE
jgi:hypothetical protein